jgi:hypothetical protein
MLFRKNGHIKEISENRSQTFIQVHKQHLVLEIVATLLFYIIVAHGVPLQNIFIRHILSNNHI